MNLVVSVSFLYFINERSTYEYSSSRGSLIHFRFFKIVFAQENLINLIRHFYHHCDIDFTLTVEKNFHQIEANAHISGKKFFCMSRSSRHVFGN